MTKQFEKTMAFHDGELPGEAIGESEDFNVDDEDTRALLDKLKQADAAFRAEAEDLLAMPVPSRLIDTIEQAESPSRTRTADIIQFPRWRTAASLAAAAGLAAVVVTNMQIFDSSNGGPPASGSNAYVAHLQWVLESTPSGDVATSEDGFFAVSPVVSLRTADSVFCREYMAQQAGQESSGLACRTPKGVWEIVSQRDVLLEDAGEAGYRAAEGESTTDGLMPGASKLTYAEEEKAIQAGWHRSGR